ncbi:MAG: 1-acyl-sn-glycerol-3-phosphate acyltransferase [Paludibacteraceae bacterium]|nr:1-acyl-sn-glycerol-3-phosphate acyltransferase [Paludibacteraceae bacterium]
MNYPGEFDDIRCYTDSEVNAMLAKVVREPQVQQILGFLFGAETAKQMVAQSAQVNSVYQFQHQYIIAVLQAIINKSCTDIALEGCENIEKTRAYLHLTNHRDITLDPAFLNYLLHFNGFNTTQIGIGNNLLIMPWIEWAVRLNKAFIVRRDGGVREQLLISKHMSAYMRYVITQVADSIWIAQREGRAKDSNDLTAPAIIKMLNMSGEGTFVEKLRELHIAPVAINYEFDPCDYLKAKEFQQKRDNPLHKKTPQDDIINMQVGIMGFKGRVRFAIANELEVPESWNDVPRANQADVAAAAIDKLIHANYHLFPNNYVAAYLLTGNEAYAAHFTAQEKQAFEAYIAGQVQKIDLPNRDDEFARQKMLLMYANPLFNKEKALQAE